MVMNYRFLRAMVNCGISRKKLRGGTFHRWFGDGLLSKELWAMKPDTMAKGWFLGIFLATSPFYGLQFPLVVILGVLWRVNMPLALFVQLFTNPLVAPFYYFGAFWLGAYFLGQEVADQRLTWQEMICQGWGPLLLGCTLVGFFVGGVGYFGIKLVGRAHQQKKLAA